jgi:DNA-binding transcriptional ArsR family regulator
MARPSKLHQLTSIQSTSSSPMDDGSLKQITRLLAALADPTRLTIISLLFNGERHVGELAFLMHKTESAISHQLRSLRQAAIVDSHQHGRRVYYTLADQHIAMIYQQLISHAEHIAQAESHKHIQPTPKGNV